MKKKGIRILAMILVVASLAGTVAAAGSYNWLDQNGDHVVNIWDAQNVLFGDKEATQKKNFLAGIKGAILDIASVNADFKTEGSGDSLTYLLSTPLDLYHLAAMTSEETADKTFKLTADIDLEGINWKPLRGFAGTLTAAENADGIPCKIHNFTITESVVDSNYPNGGNVNIGFFGDIRAGATVENLHLEDFTIEVPETSKALYVGGVAGSVRGTLSGCTADGKIVDSRESCNGQTIYHGLICGRIPNTAPAGTVTLGEMTTVANDTDAGVTVNAVMALDLYVDTESQTKFVGWQPDGTDVVNGVWRDTSYGYDTLSKNEQDRRDTVVDYMYAQGSIQWTPSKTFAYVTNKGRDNAKTLSNGTKYIDHIHNNLYEAGRVYTGVPYNYNLGTLERFMTQVETDQQTGDYIQNNGVYTIAEVSDGLFNNYRTDADQSLSGFAQYMGNNCSGAIVLAWSRVAHSRHNFDYQSELKKDGYNGFRGLNTYTMIPSTLTAGTISTAVWDEEAQKKVTKAIAYDYSDFYGVEPVGWMPINTRDALEIIDSMDDNDDLTGYGSASARTGSLSEADYQGMAECYAQTNGGDVLAWSLYNENNVQTSSAHVRMIACDPVVVRNSSDGSINLEQSYFLTHEQGDGLNDNRVNNGTYETGIYEYTDPLTGETTTYQFNIKPTSWRTNYKYTFSTLLTKEGYENTTLPGCGYGYIPVTMPAFTYNKGLNAKGVVGCDNIYVDAYLVDAQYLYKYTVKNADGTTVRNEDGTAKTAAYTTLLPDQGSIYTHYKPVSSTLTIYDETGSEVIYEETRYVGVNSDEDVDASTGYRGNFLTVDMYKLHQDYDRRAEAAGKALSIGTTYQYKYTLYLINGRTIELGGMKYATGATHTFTYTGQSSDTGGTGNTDDGSSGETGNEGEGGA